MYSKGNIIRVLQNDVMLDDNDRSGSEQCASYEQWINAGSMIDPTKTAQQNATDILNRKYGFGNWKKGPKTEYNEIVKWIQRHLMYYRGR